MTLDENSFLNAVKKLREEENKREKKRNFDQTVDLIVNLKNFDARKESLNTFISVPHPIKEKKIAGFLEKKHKLIYVITKDDFGKYKSKKEIKKLVNEYDFFISNAKLMPLVATNFGRILGPVGKMPSPQLGLVTSEDENVIASLIIKINSYIRVRVKEPSIKIGIAKSSLSDKEISDNAFAVYSKIAEILPRKIDNIRNVKIKFTMGKPVRVEQNGN